MIKGIPRLKGGDMYSEEKLLKMLESNKASVRYDACEWLRVSQDSSPEIVTALERATHDDDKEVSERATLALLADVHHQIAIGMGLIEPDETKQGEPDQSGENNNRTIIQHFSGHGIASLGVMIFIVIFSIVLYIFLEIDIPNRTMFEYYINQLQFWSTRLCIAIPILSLVAIILGVLSFGEKEQEQAYAIIGITGSIFIIILFFLIFLGLSGN
jgi:hypothetical protein